MARSSSALSVLAACALALVLLHAPSSVFVGTGGLAPAAARAAVPRSGVALRATATADTMSKVGDIIAEQLGV
eukprot:CAMPEP_0204197614 /NCGR_PEP_ID=MMETSP0361-20130328/64701_1 /ASSEMBLY_ACC=CAM_ASM_000343 /TAXON_ID=268821 /ORGANISM="Scrippsiella Hangoei, Strain SHTV-5" /LENGTH=72 /DNA_ID=CAMNT_0051159591 /DNA_START=29 /DNA_END=243 /DNA_ORIENTATION=+